MKIRDRIMLSMVAGLGGTLVKSLVVRGAMKKKWAEFDGAETAAGMLIPAHQVYSTQGKVVGEIANLIVGLTFSVPIIYMLSLTGKDKALLKGAALGSAAWVALYGSLANLGLTKVRPSMPLTAITQIFAHAAYGATVSLLATGLGDQRLFDGTIPLFTGKQAHLQQEDRIKDRGEDVHGQGAEATAEIH